MVPFILVIKICFSAAVSVYLLERNTARVGIDCPGDTISYNCSILSNSETIHLIWTITLPGQASINITYDSTSTLNNNDIMGANINTILKEYRRDEYIESILTLTVLSDIVLDGSMIGCSISDLSNNSTMVYVNTTGK